ncbi:hypothetical protein L1987_37920 [Smallanthus sonchifolius]|uniref:Uncharacterized protein n=1 Tax=Smallanthus sonchifolius TaxID=185202 RepID=A0ACB9HHH4_9ASTR|nr:hypothetical protein L1987_37920 [Smallanthus sonchifolius]
MVKSCDEQFISAMQLVTSASLTMVLVTSIKLKVLEVIAEAGPDAQLSAHEITSRLSIVNPHAPNMLDRMLKLLASHSVVTCGQMIKELKPVRVYGLAPVAKYLIPNEDGVSLGIPFDKVHGANTFEVSAINAQFNEIFNKSMVHHSTLVIKEVLKHYHGFDKLKRVVDVGVEYVGGDVFQNVPEGDAIFMKFLCSSQYQHRCDNDDTRSLGKEDEFLALAKCAGFSGIRKECVVYNFWVMEIFKDQPGLVSLESKPQADWVSNVGWAKEGQYVVTDRNKKPYSPLYSSGPRKWRLVDG